MQHRKYVIPTMSALTMGVTAACTQPVVGDWEVTSLTQDGETTEFPYTYEGQGYSVMFEQFLRVEKDLSTEFITFYSYTYNGQSGASGYSYALDGEKTGSREYSFTGGEDISFACTMPSKAELSCDGEGTTFTLMAPAEDLDDKFDGVEITDASDDDTGM